MPDKLTAFTERIYSIAHPVTTGNLQTLRVRSHLSISSGPEQGPPKNNKNNNNYDNFKKIKIQKWQSELTCVCSAGCILWKEDKTKQKKHVPMPTPGPCPLSLHVWYEQSLLARQSWSDQSAVAVSENNHQNHHLECKKKSISLISKHVGRNSTKKGGQRNKQIKACPPAHWN